MALPATAVLEVRSTATANNVNGAGFNSARGGTDYTLQNAAQLTNTDLTCTAASTTVTSAGGGFTDAMKGNYIHLTALTGTGAIVGWYEIVSVTDTNNAVLDRTPTDGANNITAGTFYVGGAASLVSTLDDDFFEMCVAGNIIYVKGGATPITYTLGEAVNMVAAGGTQAPIKIIGYSTTRGDNPTDGTRPTFACGANNFNMSTNWEISFVELTGTGSSLLSLSNAGKSVHCKVTNSSTTANRVAIGGGLDCLFLSCEGISYRGRALSVGGTSQIIGCYLHDSNVAIYGTTSISVNIMDTIMAHCATLNFGLTGALLVGFLGINNIFYGAENKYGTGVSFVTGTTDVRLINNIFYGFVTAVTHADVQSVGYDDYNCYNNNTTDVNNWTKGSNDVTTNPAFTNVTQKVNLGTVTSTTNVLTDDGADFSTITDNVDHILIRSMTGTGGVTDTFFGITAHTATTLTLTSDLTSSGGGSNIVYSITLGNDFLPTATLSGYPGIFPGGFTTGSKTIGAVQKAASSGNIKTYNGVAISGISTIS